MRDTLTQWCRVFACIAACGLGSSAALGQNTAGNTLTITNTANATFGSSLPNAAGVAQASNTVDTTVEIPPPVVQFFRNNKFTDSAAGAHAGDDLYLQAIAKGCTRSGETFDTVQITVKNLSTGDWEVYTAYETETDPASEIFQVRDRIETKLVAGGAAHPEDRILELNGRDQLQASVVDCGGESNTTLLIDPAGVVFDSFTNAPVMNTVVRLIDVTGAGNGGHPGGDAVVFDFDGVTRMSAVQTTKADGAFQFPLVPPSEYQLVITPPGDFKFPSRYTPEQLPGRTINVTGSYGGAFPVNEQTGLVILDVPLDSPIIGLSVRKTTLRPTAEIGETVQYTVAINNQVGVDLSGITVNDTLPLGFTYVPGSAQLGGVRIADPAGGKGPVLRFAIDSIATGVEALLTYRVLVGPAAMQGTGINRAQAFSTLPAYVTSNISSATVRVQGGVFDDRAYVLGKMFADCNSNGVQDAGEQGVPGVRLYMEDGTYAITDGEGRYSLYGVSPRTHVMKVDATTLPNGVKMAPIAHRNAGNGNTLFLDVQRGEMHRADFATAGCSDTLADAIKTRQGLGEGQANVLGRELDLGLKNELKTDELSTQLGDVRALPAAGVVGDAQTQNSQNPMPTSIVAMPAALGAAVAMPQLPNPQSLEALMSRLDGTLGFIGIEDGDELGSTQATVRVHGVAGATLELKVNDHSVEQSRVGAHAIDSARQIQALEYIGVELQQGANRLVLVQRDVGGNIRAIKEIGVVAAGNGARITLEVPKQGVPADGERSAHIRVNVLDSQGTPVAARTAVTLEASLGEWETPDLDSYEPGTQVFVEGGSQEFLLRAPFNTGSSTIRATGAGADAVANVSFVAALRPLVGVGLIEGTLNMKKLDAGALVQAHSSDGFEEELRSWSGGDDDNGYGARAAVFLKGKIRGDYLLTLGFDSDKEKNERLFRDIQPDQFYPVYGDSSVKGYDAQSTGRLYVRVDRNKSYLLGGDITTGSLSQERNLGAYNRSLTGVKEHFETDRLAIEAFASHDSNTQLIQEIPANGTSGPFFLSNLHMMENSEQIEIITRDRNQPSLIIQTLRLVRFTDYEIESLTGRILFRAPVPSVDPDLNPVSIRITYEVDQGGDKFWTAGIDSKFTVNDKLEVGAALIDDRNPLDKRRIASANTTVRVGENTKVIAEAARTQREFRDDGFGERIEVRHEGDQLQFRAFGAHTDENFYNPSASVLANRSEAGAKAGYSLNERTRLVGEALHSEDVTTGDARNGVLVGVERSFEHNVKAELGLRHVVDEPSTGGSTETTSVRTKVSTPLPMAPRASVFGEYEQAVDSDGRVVAAGGSYQLANRSKIYARQEFISSLTGPYALDASQKHNTTVIGIDTAYLQDDHLFSEYRVGDSLSGRESQAAIGLRNGWQLARGLRLNTSLERVDALSGRTATGDSSAVTGAIEYTRNPLWKGTARLELRESDSSDGVLSTLGLAYKLSRDWTFLGKNVFAITDNKGLQPDRTQDRLQFGFAYRDSATNRVNALTRYEFKHEDNVDPGLGRTVHIFSAHADYQMARATVVRGQYAVKLAQEKFSGVQVDSLSHLIAGRVTQDIGTRWDAGLHVRTLVGNSMQKLQGGVGAEVGYLVHDNLWVSAGYNISGFRDDDLAGGEYTDRGGYLRLRFKFDETLLD